MGVIPNGAEDRKQSGENSSPDVVKTSKQGDREIMRGKPWAADFTCANTVALTYLPITSFNAGAGAAASEAQKTATHRELQEDLAFSGIGIETLGSFGPEAVKIVSHLGKLIKEKSDKPRAHEFLRQRISVALQRGNAKRVLGTFKEIRGLEEIFYVLFRWCE